MAPLAILANDDGHHNVKCKLEINKLNDFKIKNHLSTYLLVLYI